MKNTHNCHHPRKRVIQYSRDISDKSRGRGVLDRPVKPDDDELSSHRQPRAIIPGNGQRPHRARRLTFDRHGQKVFRAPLLAALDQNLTHCADFRRQSLR
jgi:hypothetical protein